MKTNKYGTPKERIIKMIGAFLFICMIFLLNGVGKKFYLSQYQEECYEHEWYNSTYCAGYWSYEDYKKVGDVWYKINLTEPICKCEYYYYTNGCLRTISLPNESKCLKYHLVRLSDG